MKTKHYRAAGGVVLDGKGQVLLLVRDVIREGRAVHEVRLPKGHVDDGETDEQAALRETCEESGYCDLSVAADLGEYRSEYTHNGRRYIRDEHFFLMKLRSPVWQAPQVHPDSEEALFSVRWCPSLSQAVAELSYPSEQEFARRALAALTT